MDKGCSVVERGGHGGSAVKQYGQLVTQQMRISGACLVRYDDETTGELQLVVANDRIGTG